MTGSAIFGISNTHIARVSEAQSLSKRQDPQFVFLSHHQITKWEVLFLLNLKDEDSTLLKQSELK